MKNSVDRTKKMVIIAMFCALAYIVMLVGRIPLGFVDFLKYDPKDIIITLAGFIFGPLSALIVTVVVAFIEMFTASGTGFIGFFMNVLASAAFACVASLVYKKYKTMIGAMAGVILGTLSMTVVMVLWNYLITPLYMGISRETVAAMLTTVFMPFNLIKGGINAAITLILYRPVIFALKKGRLIQTETYNESKKGMAGVIILSVLVLITLIFVVLVKLGKI